MLAPNVQVALIERQKNDRMRSLLCAEDRCWSGNSTTLASPYTARLTRTDKHYSAHARASSRSTVMAALCDPS
jgi:hypothetical protein